MSTTGSISTGATSLGVTQQAVSARIAAAERSLGTALVHRGASGSRLTPAGQVLLELAEPLLAASDRLEAGLRALSNPAGSVTVAASQTIAEVLVPDWLLRLRAERPDLQVRLIAGNSTDVVTEVRRGRAAIGFVEGPAVPADLQHQVIGVDELVVVVAPGHPWATASSVGLADLSSEALLVRESGSGTRAVLESWLAAEGRVLQVPAAEIATTAAIRAHARAAVAPAVVSIRSVHGDLDQGRLVRVPVDGPPLRRTFAAVWVRGLDAAAASVLEVARATP